MKNLYPKIQTPDCVKKILVLTAVIFLFSHLSVRSQGNTRVDSMISLEVNDAPLYNVLSEIESHCPYKFAYNTELILRQKTVSLKVAGVRLKDLLDLLFRDTEIMYTIINNQIILQKREAPKRITINGFIRAARTGEFLIGATILIPDKKAAVISNNYGFYSITVPPGDSLQMIISYVGYKSEVKQLSALKDASLNFDLSRNRGTIQAVVFAKDGGEENVRKNQAGMIELSAEMLASAPSLDGSGDIMNAMPGVQTAPDGSTGYSVRGGNSDQNLVQLDEATLYNPNHLFGLVSVFNSSAIKKASLFKGGFPASYGGNLSSILDVTMKDGSNQQLGGVVQLGTMTSGFSLNGPIQQDKSSFLISARRSTIDQLLRPIDKQNYFSNSYFYDVNGKVNFRLSQWDRIFLSFYKGSDYGSYSTDSSDAGNIDYHIEYGNQASTVRWNHLFSKKLFSNTSVIYNNYHQWLTAIQEDYFAQLYSGISGITAKTDLYYYPSPKHNIRGGVNYAYQTLFPATQSDRLSTSGFISLTPQSIPQKNLSVAAAYISDEMKIGSRLNLYTGLRVPYFQNPDTTYLRFEPRISLLVLMSASSSFKISYVQMHQYIHQVQSYNASFPAEIWIGSSKVVLPQASQQFTAGIYKNFKENTFQVSIEGYYKTMANQMLFKGGADSTLTDDIESRLIFGNGWSYGTEFFARKKAGKWTAMLSYSLSYAYLKFDSLNGGAPFPMAYNRRHSFYASARYSLSKSWRVAASLFITSGRSFTLNNSPISSSNQNVNPFYDDESGNGNSGSPVQESPNNYHLAPYNRMDVSINYRKSWQIGRRKLQSQWMLSVYNVYGHPNTFLAYRSIDPVSKQVFVRQIPIIPIIPSLSYTVRF